MSWALIEFKIGWIERFSSIERISWVESWVENWVKRVKLKEFTIDYHFFKIKFYHCKYLCTAPFCVWFGSGREGEMTEWVVERMSELKDLVKLKELDMFRELVKLSIGCVEELGWVESWGENWMSWTI